MAAKFSTKINELLKKLNFSSVGTVMQDLIDGSILMRSFVVRQYFLILIIAVLSIVYIASRYQYNQRMRQNSELKSTIDSLRFVYLDEQSKYMMQSRESNIEEIIKKNIPDLEVCQVPPVEIDTEQ